MTEHKGQVSDLTIHDHALTDEEVEKLSEFTIPDRDAVIRRLTTALRDSLPTMRMAWNMLDTYANCDESYGTGCALRLVRETADELDTRIDALRALAEIGESDD